MFIGVTSPQKRPTSAVRFSNPPEHPASTIFAERAVRLVVKETCYKMAQNIASGSRNRGQLQGNRWRDGVEEMSRQERGPRGPSHRQITFNAPDKDGTGRALAIVNDSEEATRRELERHRPTTRKEKPSLNWYASQKKSVFS